jgi:hypothetical protein
MDHVARGVAKAALNLQTAFSPMSQQCIVAFAGASLGSCRPSGGSRFNDP